MTVEEDSNSTEQPIDTKDIDKAMLADKKNDGYSKRAQRSALVAQAAQQVREDYGK
jgi:hypothetical protein